MGVENSKSNAMRIFVVKNVYADVNQWKRKPTHRVGHFACKCCRKGTVTHLTMLVYVY